MAIKGFSEEIVQAMDFDPFAELGSDGGTENRAPRAPVPGARDGTSGGQQPAVPVPQKDPVTGRFLPTGGTPTQRANAARNAQPGRDVSPDGARQGQTREAQRVPTAPPVRPDEPVDPQGGTPPAGNSVQELMERVKQAGPVMPTTPVQQEPGPGQRPQPQFPRYDYSKPWTDQKVQLPAELLDAIFHEDRSVAAQGMDVLVNTMYNSLANEIHTRIAAIVHQVPQVLENMTDMRMGQRQLRDKFYGQFPELANPQGMQTVYSIAQNVAALYQNMGQEVDPMSDDFVNYVGEQARQVLGIAPAPQRQPRRQFQPGGGTRNGGGSNGNPFMEAIGLA
jgi:hypothetical protein